MLNKKNTVETETKSNNLFFAFNIYRKTTSTIL